MFTTHKLASGSMLIVVALVLILVAVGFGQASGTGSPRANDAWSDRLTGQAAHEQAKARNQAALDAYAARYTGQTQSFENLIRQAEAARAERANKAWSDRLTKMAAAAAAAK